MYLSSLDIHGFKSFATATELRFDAGITAIVGPNGSGKSNIVDALRWVIGEQRVRILRSDKMNNIIFNGSAKRRPLGMAEVRLTIENSRQVLPVEYSVITIGRRLYRSGEAEYLLNGTPCRLRDIQDLFSDTGMGAGAYSVIELKMIDEILSDKTQDRRRLFEEAAGLTKYKQRRSQAIRKLDITQADLARVHDLTEEISRRTESLKRQAAVAARHKRYEERIQELDYTLLQMERHNLELDKAAVTEQLQQLEDELTRWITQGSVDEASVETVRSALIAAESSAASNTKNLNDHRTTVTGLEADLRIVQEKQASLKRELKRIEQEDADDQGRHQDHSSQAKALRKGIGDAELIEQKKSADLEAAENTLRSARAELQKQQEKLHRLRSAQQQLVDEHAIARRDLARYESSQTWLTEDGQRLEQDKSLLESAIAEREADRLQLQSKCKDQVQAEQVATSRFVEAREKHDRLLAQIGSAEQALQTLKQEAAAKAAESETLQSLVASREEFPDAVRFLSESVEFSHLRTISDVVTCSPDHQSLLAAALGEYGACIVAPSYDEAVRILHFLKSQGQGRAMVAALDRVPTKLASQQADTRVGQSLRDFVVIKDDTCGTLINWLLQDVICVDTLDQAANQQKTNPRRPMRYVTADGEWLDDYGFVHGGGQSTAPVLTQLSRRDALDKCKDALRVLDDKIARQQDRRARLGAQVADLNLEVLREAGESAAAKSQLMQQELRSLEDQLATLRVQSDQLQQRERQVEEKLASSGSMVQKLRSRAAKIDADCGVANEAVLEAGKDLDGLQGTAQQAHDVFAEKKAEAVKAKAQCGALQRQLDMVLASQAELSGRIESRQRSGLHLEAQRASNDQKLSEFEQVLRTERGRRGGLDEAVQADSKQLMRLRVKLNRLEENLRKLRRGRETAQSRVTEQQMQHVALSTRLEDVISRMEEFPSPMAVSGEVTDPEALLNELNALKKKMRGMGRVNALALEEYEEEKQRLEFMTGQCRDLQEAEATLARTIQEINVAAANQFSEVFDVIRGNFQELFEELFGSGATCDLVLANEDDVLESPIDIMAKPRGKRPVNINQLSSGEKTLTAIALLFSIYMVKPSPFCFLDEVDAPLDDANIDRYMRLIRRFADDTQFVLVTHNKRTMEMADRLYGITMQERGVSSMVGVQFEQALAIAGTAD